MAAIAVCGIAASFAVSSLIDARRLDAQRQRRETLADTVTHLVEMRAQAHEAILRGGRAVFSAIDQVTPRTWQLWTRSRLGSDGREGIRALGFLRFVPRGRLAEVTREEAAHGVEIPPPESVTHDFLIVTRLGPDGPDGLAAGADLARRPGVRATAEAAVLDGPLVTPLQPGGGDLFVLLPVFDDGRERDESKEHLRGWVFAWLDPSSIDQALVPGTRDRVDVSVYDDLTGASLDGRLAPTRLPRVAAAVRHIRVNGRRTTIEVRLAPDGSDAWDVLERHGPLVSGWALTLMAIGLVWTSARTGLEAERRAHDMTEDLRAAQEDRDRVFDLSLELLAVVSPDGRIVRANQAMAQALGCSVASLLGRPLVDWVHEEHRDDFRMAIAGASHVGSVPCEDTKWVRADGTTVLMSWTLTVAGDAGRVNAFGRDVTDDRETHIALERQASMLAAQAVEIERSLGRAESSVRAKGAFFATVSHEVRTPMNGIIGMADVLLDSPLSAEQREGVLTIQRVAESLLAILTDVLDLSQMESSSLTLQHVPFDPQAVVEDAVRVYTEPATRRGIRVTTAIDPAVPAVLVGDPDRLRQVLGNLLSNAVKFTPSGSIHVAVERIGVEGSLAELCFAVRDTGVGMDADTVTRLFEPFWQAESGAARRYGGMGLGLTVCDRLVRLMGGAMRVESREGAGSDFYFTTWFEEAPVEHRGGGGVVTVAVSDPRQRDSLLWKLRQLGFEATLRGEHGLAPASGSAPRHDDPDEAPGSPRALVFSCDPERPTRPDAGPGYRRVCVPVDGLRPPCETCTANDAVLRSTADAVIISDALSSVSHVRPTHVRRPAFPVPDAPAGEPPPSPRPAASGSGPRVLVVEDNPVNLRVTVRFLEKLGCAVDVAVDGREALDAIARARYDVVFMDCQMPVMDGFEATRSVRAAEHGAEHLRIVALTANAMPGDRERCLEAGMDDFLPKPVRVDDLRAALARAAA